MHHRSRIRLGIMIGRERNCAQSFLPHAMLVHVALDPHGKTLGRREHAVRHQICLLTRNSVDTCCLPEAAVLSLSQRAEHHHAIR